MLAVVLVGAVLTLHVHSGRQGTPASTQPPDPAAAPDMTVIAPTATAPMPPPRRRGADDPLPPIDEPDLRKLIEAYDPDELRMLAEVEKTTRQRPPPILRELVRKVRRECPPAEAEAFIREQVPGIPTKTIAYDWAMRRLHGVNHPPRPHHQGGGTAIIDDLHGSPTPHEEQVQRFGNGRNDRSPCR